MASYGNTALTSAGIDLVKRVIANTTTFEITKVATSSDSRLTNATISTIEALTTLPSVQQTGKVTAFDTSNSKQVGLKCEFTNQGLTNSYNICGVGIYAKEAGKSEILFAVAPANEPETMPAKPNDQSALFTFSLNMYVVIGQASAMTITATTEGVVKSINGTIKPDANGNVTLSYYSQAEVDAKLSAKADTTSVKATADSLNTSIANAQGDIRTLQQTAKGLQSTVENWGTNLYANTSDVLQSVTFTNWYIFYNFKTEMKGQAVTTKVWIEKPTQDVVVEAYSDRSDGRWHSNTIKAGESGYANVTFIVPTDDWSDTHVSFLAVSGGETTLQYKDLRIMYGDISKLQDTANKLQSDLTNAKGAISSLDAKLSTKADTTSVKATADSLATSIANAQGDIRNLQNKTDNISSTVSNLHIGDRNLARGVASSKDWFIFQGFNNRVNYCSDLVTYSLDTLKAGDKVTFGITMKNDGVTSGTMIFQQYGDVSVLNRDFGGVSQAGNVINFVPNGAEKTLIYTFPITAGMLNGNSAYTIQIRTDNVPEGGKLCFRYAFVKKGTLATDWTPAPEDVDDSIFQIKQAASKLQSDLTNAKGAISSLDAKMPQAAYVPTVLVDKTDLNDMKTCGFYMLQCETINNAPIPGWLYVKVLGIPTRLTQFVWQDLDPAQQWCRLYYESKWTPWTHYTKAL